jgi:hypothetical protein
MRPVPPNLSTAVCSITSTQRRRYFWAAWWTGEPSYAPFRKPDAAHGGARSFEDALQEAQAVAGRSLAIVDAYWARAWKSVLRGQLPAPPKSAESTKSSTPPPSASRERAPDRAKPTPTVSAAESAWHVLGLQTGASRAEVKRAYQRRALQTHPDHGGDATEFRAVQRAYEKLMQRLEARAARPQRRRSDTP